MKFISKIILAVALVFAGVAAKAQSDTSSTIVGITASAQNLTAVTADQLPLVGATYWYIFPDSMSAVPLPCYIDNGLVQGIYTLSDDAAAGVYLVDSSFSSNAVSEGVLAAQAATVANLAGEYQTVTADGRLGMGASPMDSPLAPGGGGSGGGELEFTNSYFFTPNTNAAWLTITNVSMTNGLAWLNLYVPTNLIVSGTNIYAIWTTTNLTGGWQVVAEVRLPYPEPPTNPVVVPFQLSTWDILEQPNLFVKAQAWTDMTNNGNITPIWWTWEFFGVTNLSDTNIDCDSRTLIYDYTNHLAPAEPPIITQQPASQMILSGGTVTLGVTLAAPGTFTCQWLFNGVPVVSNLITTVAGNGDSGYLGDGGAATSARLSYPTSLALDGKGNFFIADSVNDVIRRVSTNGVITTVAGNNSSSLSYSGDGGAATNASLNTPAGVALDAAGNLFIADTENNLVRKVATNGIITTVAGNITNNGVGGYWGDGGTATNALLSSPGGVAVDGSGNLYIADTKNQVVRRVNASGIITTVAGNNAQGYGGDGGAATNAELNGPAGVAVGGSYLYIADTGNNLIRQVTASGQITTVAGNYSSSAPYSADGGAATNATLSSPFGVAVSSSGTFYIADSYDGVIREVTADGLISTIAGTNSLDGDFGGDGGPAVDAGLWNPAGVAVSPAGNVYIADTGDNRIRQVTPINPTSQSDEDITLTIPDAQTNVTGGYQVVITDACGSITSSIASLVVGLKPVIVREPVNQFLLPGDEAVFTVAATAFPAPDYQWYFDSTAIAGATNAALTLMSFATNNLGNYQVVVTNYFGAVTSTVASLNTVQVYAGPDEAVTNATSLQLQGVILGSSGNAADGACVVTWSVVSEPTNTSVAFVDPNLTNSIVTFYNHPSGAGGYHLRLTLSDGQSAVSSDVAITNVTITTSTAEEVLPYRGTNYLYTYSPSNSLTNFFALTNFDGSWSAGQASFGNGYLDCGPTPTNGWPGYLGGNPYLFVRRTFTVPAAAANLNLSFAIDNDAQLFLNGILLTPVNTLFHGLAVTPNIAQVTLGYGGSGFSTDFDTSSTNYNPASPTYGQEVWLTNVFGHGGCCDTNQLVLNGIAPNLWHPGTNVLAAMVYDAGIASYFDSQITCLLDPALTNQPLAVDAGPDQFVVYSPPSCTVTLNGTISDEGLQPAGPLSAAWSEVSGPGTNVTFSPTQPTEFSTNVATVSATARFYTPGTYQLQLAASDSQRSATNFLTVIVDDGSVPLPTVSFIAPTNGETFLPETISMTATASASTGAIAEVEFNAYNNETGDSVLIGRAINYPYSMNWINPPIGNYTIEALATDEAGRPSPPAEIGITIYYDVYAGANQIITNGTTNIATNSMALQGVVLGDTGYATNSSYTASWSVVSYPQNANPPTFSNTNLTNSLVTFTGKISSLGTYVLMLTLTSDDESLTATSEVTNTIVSDDVLSYWATNYLYTYSTSDSLAGFQATNYDDSAWSSGSAGFGNGGCSLAPATGWPGYDGGNPWLYLRQQLSVPAGTTNLSLGLTVDNAAQIFLNGTLLTPTNTTSNGVSVPQNVAQALYNTYNGFSVHYLATNDDNSVTVLTNVFFLPLGRCNAYDDVVLNGLSTNLWHTGTNILAVKVYNQGDNSFFDNRISIISSTPP